jgi:hypothetical protein
MADQTTERASCRFVVQTFAKGAPTLRLELFHPIASLTGMMLDFELLSGTTLEQAKKLAESVNERAIGIIVNTKPKI